ncbi:MAG: FtsX-like permease family protein, partial [Acidobacteriaceae bacterium]
PWTGWDENTSFEIEGKHPPAGTLYQVRYHAATPDYFRALGVPLLEGRFFRDSDAHSAPVVIINSALAKKYWPGEDALGKRVAFEDHPQAKDWLTVVGIVGDVKDAPTSVAAEPGFWWSHEGAPFRDMAVVVRYDGDPGVMAAALRSEVRRLNPGLAVANVQQMDQIVEASVAAPRMEFILVGLFGGLAIVMAGIGIYGVVAYAVSQRTVEFGVRMALGAQRRDVLRLVLAQVAGLVVGGTILGLLLAVLLGRTLKSLIYGVSPADPATLATAGGLVVVVAILACLAPAHRATGVDPMITLRYE